MAANKFHLLAAAAALALGLAPAAAQRDAPDEGAALFLRGNIERAVNFYSDAVRDNPLDARAKQILANCLVIKGKQDIGAKQYASGRAALARAAVFFPGRRDLEMLDLLAQLDERAPADSVAVSTGALDIAAENAAVFECLFGGEKCAKNKYVVHVVAPGETMALIALKYYNDMKLWEKIWAANPRISNPHRLEKGTRLLIPMP
jgi:nucleoid-associated protein YgaU